ncbi:hypothetical protein ILYODFUR_000548, partial [Ilyodon furcidens]
ARGRRSDWWHSLGLRAYRRRLNLHTLKSVLCRSITRSEDDYQLPSHHQRLTGWILLYWLSEEQKLPYAGLDPPLKLTDLKTLTSYLCSRRAGNVKHYLGSG